MWVHTFHRLLKFTWGLLVTWCGEVGGPYPFQCCIILFILQWRDVHLSYANAALVADFLKFQGLKSLTSPIAFHSVTMMGELVFHRTIRTINGNPTPAVVRFFITSYGSQPPVAIHRVVWCFGQYYDGCDVNHTTSIDLFAKGVQAYCCLLSEWESASENFDMVYLRDFGQSQRFESWSREQSRSQKT